MRILIFFYILLPVLIQAQTNKTISKDKIIFYGDSKSRISSGVAIPANNKLFIISGIVASPIDTTLPLGNRGRYGDTKTQAISILVKIQKLLSEAGLSMKDLVNIKAYVTPDAINNGNFDFKGWNEAYDLFFNNSDNPNKVTRITMGIPILTNPEFLIEIEGMAVFP